MAADSSMVTPPKKKATSTETSSSKSSGKKRRYYLVPGQKVGGSYEIIEQIGEGGMAIVYKARQISLNRMVAIKALHPRFAKSKEFVERFEAESGALATMSHPHIVTIIDRGIEGNVYYFVMEFVDGEDLDKKIIANSLNFSDWRRVIEACAASLTFIHNKGIIHRDIKPSNILVSTDGQVKIADFGIAHILRGVEINEDEDKDSGDPNDTENTSASGSSRPVGTTYYMAPEQMSAPHTVDARADVYSLGVAFYKMMARRIPKGEYPAPSEVNTSIPVTVDAVLFQALALDRDDRYNTIKEFCDELLGALKEKSTNLSSIFDYRSNKSSSSLYTGMDFKPGGESDSASKGGLKDRSTPGTRKTASKAGAKTGTGGTGTGKSRPGLLTPLPLKKAGRAAKEQTPAAATPTPVASAAPTPGTPVPAAVNNAVGTKPKSNTPLILGALVALFLIAGGLVALFVIGSSSDGPSKVYKVESTQVDGEIAPLTKTKSPQMIREEQARKVLEEERQALKNGNTSNQ
jgi:serine/threonine protein kinase